MLYNNLKCVLKIRKHNVFKQPLPWQCCIVTNLIDALCFIIVSCKLVPK